MKQYSEFMKTSPKLSANDLRRLKDSQDEEHERLDRESLLQRANAITAATQEMISQHQKMIHGLNAASQNSTERAPARCDFVAMNIAAVADVRSPIGPRETALLARAKVLAAATAYLDGPCITSTNKIPITSQALPAHDQVSANLLRAAREEVERGFSLTTYEAQSRRPPRKLKRLGRC